MNLEMYAMEVVTVAAIGLIALLMAATFYCSRKRAKILTAVKNEKTEVEEAAANMVKALQYETAERLCIGMACALVAVVLLNINHSLVIDGICIIIQKLEVLLHGH